MNLSKLDLVRYAFISVNIVVVLFFCSIALDFVSTSNIF